MQADKCSGHDGFNSGFYYNFWDVCGEGVYKAGSEWLEKGAFPPHLNSINIALIPNGKSPKTMKDWRPISLCNVVTKWWLSSCKQDQMYS